MLPEILVAAPGETKNSIKYSINYQVAIYSLIHWINTSCTNKWAAFISFIFWFFKPPIYFVKNKDEKMRCFCWILSYKCEYFQRTVMHFFRMSISKHVRMEFLVTSILIIMNKYSWPELWARQQYMNNENNMAKSNNMVNLKKE